MPTDANRVAETATTTGTGTITCAGAILGHQSFGTAFGVAFNTDVHYGIVQDDTGEWEVGLGTFLGATNQLQRDTVLASSAGGSKVSFPSGSKTLYVPRPAEAVQVFRARRAADTPVAIYAAAGQTANLFQAYNAAGTASFGITKLGGVAFGSQTAAGGVFDLSRHIDLWGGTYGISITGARCNYVTPGTARHEFYSNGESVMQLQAPSLNSNVAATLAGNLRLPSLGSLQFGSSDVRIQPTASQIYVYFGGAIVSRFEVGGTSLPQTYSVVTRERGDARYASISSLRYKDAVAADTGRIAGFLDLDMHRWIMGGDLAADDFRRGKPGYGHIAEELATVFPEGVENDEQGRPDRLNVGAILGALHAEVKHLSGRVDAIEA